MFPNDMLRLLLFWFCLNESSIAWTLRKPYGIKMCNQISQSLNESLQFFPEDLSCRRKDTRKKERGIGEPPIRDSKVGPCITNEGIRQDYRSYQRENIRVYLNFYNLRMNWSEADTVCKSDAAFLFMMNSRAKRTIFSEELVTMSHSANGENVWVGLSRRSLTDKWRWSNGKLATGKLRWSRYSIFKPSKPKFKCALGVTTFDRAKFFEEKCSTTYRFICECVI